MSKITKLDYETIRFWSKVDVLRERECWEWKGATTKSGYGTFWKDGALVYAHRAVYEMAVGQIQDELFVCHHCDNRLCVNPRHLFLGTCKDNYDDMIAKGRQANSDLTKRCGNEHGCAKLTDVDVRQIFALNRRGVKPKEIADRFPVTITHVQKILSGKAWKHLNLKELKNG